MNKLIIRLIKFYRRNHQYGGRCKYMPTCSEYGLECFTKYCFLKALILTFWRILRCNPFSHGGYDPSPLCVCEKEYEFLVYDIYRKD